MSYLAALTLAVLLAACGGGSDYQSQAELDALNTAALKAQQANGPITVQPVQCPASGGCQ